MTEIRVKQRDAVRTKAELLAEATRVFAESGYSGTRVDEIARRSSTTKRMIYYYFGSKEQLYLAVLENAYRSIRMAEQALEIGDLDPVAALRKLAELTYDHHLANTEFIRLVAIENIHNGRFIRQLESVRELGVPALSILDEILSKGSEAGVFRQGIDPLDVHLLISSYCVFQVANQHTFGFLFEVDLQDLAHRNHLRAQIGDIAVAWVSAPLPVTAAG